MSLTLRQIWHYPIESGLDHGQKRPGLTSTLQSCWDETQSPPSLFKKYTVTELLETRADKKYRINNNMWVPTFRSNSLSLLTWQLSTGRCRVVRRGVCRTKSRRSHSTAGVRARCNWTAVIHHAFPTFSFIVVAQSRLLLILTFFPICTLSSAIHQVWLLTGPN